MPSAIRYDKPMTIARIKATHTRTASPSGVSRNTERAIFAVAPDNTPALSTRFATEVCYQSTGIGW